MVAMMPVSDPLSSLRCWLITIEGDRKLKKMASMHAEATRVNQDAFNILLEICMSMSEFGKFTQVAMFDTTGRSHSQLLTYQQLKVFEKYLTTEYAWQPFCS